ncbi:1-acyl-sn-glycerol-3-phosphate acyltransferase [bacterium]|nr:1-acyl-sn-glycerol-3-phosphate acyltransferase [bacterium]
MKKFLMILKVFICVLIFGAGAVLISFVLFPAGAFFVKDKKEFFTRVIHKSWKIYTHIMLKIHAIELSANEEIKNIRQKIIVASHPTFIDIVLLIGLIPKSVCIAKKELLKNPILKNIVKNAYIINDVETFSADAAEFLKEGYNVIIFPAGTRTTEGEDFKVHKGAAQLGIETGVDIVPIKISCDCKFLAKNSSMFEVGGKIPHYTLTLKPQLKISDYKKQPDDCVKLRKIISADIKSALV